MSRNRTIRNSRHGLRFRQAAGLWAASLLLIMVSGSTAMAQKPRGFHPVQQYRQRQAERRVANNRPPANPNARPPMQPQAQPQAQPHQPAPIERAQSEAQPRPSQSEGRPTGNATPVRPAPPTSNGQLVSPNRPGQTQQHLGVWMQSHSNMPLAEQHRALDNEPNFRSLPPQEQQQLHQRLSQLNAMPRPQRDKVIDRTEKMEHLPPRQRQQVRDAMSQLGSLPEDRQHAVAHAFHQALTMPESQRQAWLNSQQVHSQFNDNERNTLNHLLEVQPAAAQAGFDWARPPVSPQAPRE